MSAFIHHHYALCLISAVVLGLALGVGLVILLVRIATGEAIGRGLDW